MGLSVEQLGRLRERFPTLEVEGSCTVKDCWFGENVRLGAGASVVESKIGSGSVIGAGSEVMRAEVGKNVRVGAGAKIFAGARVGDGAVIAEGAQVSGQIGGAVGSEGDADEGLELTEFLLEKLPLVHVWKRWNAEGGERLRLAYPLDANSVVVDAGGYRGDFAEEVVGKFGCAVEVFEPVRKFAEGIVERLKGRGGVRVHGFGLAGSNRAEEISLELESSSVVKAAGAAQRETIQLRRGSEALAGLGRIDLLKINIEGCEYELLEELMEAGEMERVRFLQVQFHDFIAGARERRRAIVERLKKTHRREWNYPFIWESWQRLGG